MLIYVITNLINNKQYVGQTTRSLKRRWYIHGLHIQQGRSHYIQNAIRKYGKKNFTIQQIDSAESIEELNEKENFGFKN